MMHTTTFAHPNTDTTTVELKVCGREATINWGQYGGQVAIDERTLRWLVLVAGPAALSAIEAAR